MCAFLLIGSFLFADKVQINNYTQLKKKTERGQFVTNKYARLNFKSYCKNRIPFVYLSTVAFYYHDDESLPGAHSRSACVSHIHTANRVITKKLIDTLYVSFAHRY